MEHQNYFQRNKNLFQAGCASLLLLAIPEIAFADSIGNLLNPSGHGGSELKSYFNFAVLAFAFVGFIIAGICLVGMAMIKMAPNNPNTQKFEQAGMGGLFVGMLLGGALMTLSGLAYLLIGTALGSSGETDALDSLKSGAIEMAPDHLIARLDLSVIPVKGTEV